MLADDPDLGPGKYDRLSYFFPDLDDVDRSRRSTDRVVPVGHPSASASRLGTKFGG
jgi:hypothetical protein